MPKVMELESGQHGARGRSGPVFKDLKYRDGEAFQTGVSDLDLEGEQN